MKTASLLLAAVLLWPGSSAQAQCVSLTTVGSASTQNFDTLSNTAGSTTNNLTITGWFLTETGGGPRDNEQYGVDTGGSNTGDTYSYGSAGNTNRALGGLQSGTLIPVIGACFTNNTGATLGSLDLAYSGEQWRLGAVARTDQLDFQYSLNATSLTTGSWTDVNALDFVAPVTAGSTGALNGDVAPNRTAISSSITALSIANGATFWIRWNDLNASGSDDGLAVDDFSLTPQSGGPVTPTLTLNDVALSEGNAGTTTFTFTVSLSAPAGPGGATFDIATADGTAQDDNPATEDNDYVGQSLTGQTIPAGSSTYAFNVQVNGDPTTEPNETFFVNVTNLTGATVGDGQGQGTINNDDVSLTPIHDIQGPGASSPIVGASVTTSGIVTGVRSNGFFLQEPDATVDADPATSEGIFVFTGAAPPAAAAVGNRVQVTATVVEFVPAQDLLQPPLTELTGPTVTLLSAGNPLPAAFPLTATFPDPAGPHDQLERLEGMRVSVASLTVGAPTTGSISEANATATSNGVFQGTITGVPRAFREAGIQAPDPAPAGGTIPPIPRFDTNPEVIRVDSDGLVGGPLISVSTGTVVTGLVGPLDYGFRRYSIYPDPGATIGVTGGSTPVAAAVPVAGEVTIASYNLQRFFDTVNDPAIGEPVLTPAAFDARLNKASLGIRNFLNTPDIVGVIEVENLSTLQALAARISADAIAATQPDPQYLAFLVEGNDVGGIDVGFLVKTAPVAPLNTARVTVNSVTQELDGTLFVNPDTSTETLNDRPPLRLDGTVNNGTGQTWPVTVIVNHLRSLNGVNDESAGSNGWATAGARVRAKRQAQAVDLAGLVQARQTANPAESIVLVGDFNAFEVNDGLADLMNTIAGTPVPDNQTAVPGDGVDLVTPDFTNLFATEPLSERYSYVFDGNAQSIDHILVNAAVVAGTAARRIDHARINSDFPEIDRNSNVIVQRLSDHDPVLLYVSPVGFQSADVSISAADSPDPVTAGNPLSYTITVGNAGPAAAATVAWSTTLPAGTQYQSLAAPGGWSCTTPAIGAGGAVNCSVPTLAVAGSAVFTLNVGTAPSLTAGSSIDITLTATTSTPDSNPANNTASASTAVASAADLSIAVVDNPDPVTAGAATNLAYTVTVANAGPSDAAGSNWSATLPAGTSFVSLPAVAGWTCTTPAVGAGGTVNCSAPTVLAMAMSNFVLTVSVAKSTAAGTLLSLTATVTTMTNDPTPGNNSDTETTSVGSAADLAVTAVDSADPVNAGSAFAYTLTVSNLGPSAATAVALNATLPAGTQFQAVTLPAGWSCPTQPAVGAAGALNCTTASLGVAAGPAVFSVNVVADPLLADGTLLSLTAAVSSGSTDPLGTNNSDTETTTVSAQANLAASVGVSPGFVPVGGTLTITATLSNGGPGAALDAQLATVVPSGLQVISSNADGGGSCASSGSGAVTVTCTWSGSTAAGVIRTVTIQARAVGAVGSPITTTASAQTADPVSANNNASVTLVVGADAVAVPFAGRPALLLLLGLILAMGTLTLRRRTG